MNRAALQAQIDVRQLLTEKERITKEVRFRCSSWCRDTYTDFAFITHISPNSLILILVPTVS